jgi:hypothetical protein
MKWIKKLLGSKDEKDKPTVTVGDVKINKKGNMVLKDTRIPPLDGDLL